MTLSSVVESSDVVRHWASRHPALSYDVVRSVNTALVCYMLSPIRLSVCLSVTLADQSRTVQVRIMKFSPYGIFIPLVFAE